MSALRWSAVIAMAAVLACALKAGRAAKAQLASYAPSPHAVLRPAHDAFVDSARDVELRTAAGLVLHGWSGPSTNGAAIVLVSGSDADRTQLLPEADILAGAGYGVLVFDRPGVGESTGAIYTGDELAFLRVAVDALTAQPGVDGARIGGLGFSSGAAFLAEAAASDARLRGVVLAGCYTDADEYILHFRGRGPLTGYPALWAAEWAGITFPHPVARVSAFAPRSLLVVTGDGDPTVPPAMSQQLYAAASEPKELWIVKGAAHGEYERVAPRELGERLLAFFGRALLGHAPAPVSESTAP
jgi:fermentation-respiration switch protein FrsA (DUF1100 family)